MRIIIPAAGIGNRLRPMTDDRPKCLVEVNGRSILDRLLQMLSQRPVKEVIIVTGGFKEKFEEVVSGYRSRLKIILIQNDLYATTNSMLSISLTTPYWDKDFCIIDSDLLIKDELLDKLIGTAGSFLIIDNSKPANEIDMSARVVNDTLIYLGKELTAEETFGEFFGLSKWTVEAGVVFSEMIRMLLKQNGQYSWYEFAIREIPKVYKLPVITCSSDQWFEIDSVSDYEKACQLFPT